MDANGNPKSESAISVGAENGIDQIEFFLFFSETTNVIWVWGVEFV